MNKKVCGADVCKDKIVCCFITEPVRRIKEEFKDGDHEFFEFEVKMNDVTRFLEHRPTHLVLEPTGTNYSWIWAEIAVKHGIEVLWVDNVVSRNKRKSFGLPDKNDQADALTLAKIGFRPDEYEDALITYCHRDGLSLLRESVLQLESLQKMINMITARIRQQLAREFPEAALSDTKESADGEIPLWAWLARRERNLKRKSTYHDDKWKKSVACYLGIEISDFTRSLAASLCDLYQEKKRLNLQIKVELSRPEFSPYYNVIRRFGLNDKAIAFIVAMIFPIEKFFHKKGMRRARARFKQRLGLGQIEESSGDKSGSRVGGSALSRKLLNVYVAGTAGNLKKWTPKNQYQDAFVDYYIHLCDRWSKDPDAIAARERIDAINKVNQALDKSLNKIANPATIQTIKQSVAESISVKPVKEGTTVDAKKRWTRLINSRTAAKLAELIWKELLDEFHPKN